MYLGLFGVCWIVFVGQDCVKMSDPIWLVALSVRKSPPVSHGPCLARSLVGQSSYIDTLDMSEKGEWKGGIIMHV